MKFNIDQHAVCSLFTMVIVIDQNLNIVSCSDRLTYRCPVAKPGVALTEVFDINRPNSIRTFRDIVENEGSLYLMTSSDNKFGLRGQVICPQGADSEEVFFVGSPWLLWMAENQPETALEMADFPKHDAQMDHEFYIASQKAVVEDLETLNSELREARDAAHKAEQTRSSFFAIMSHEMRTPLNGVISALSLINDNRDQETHDKLLNVAQASAKNLLAVINYVLDYSKLEAGKMDLEEDIFDIKESLGAVTDILRAKASAKDISLQYHISEDCPRWVVGDHSKLQQVLINLASNGVKFTHEGSVDIRVSCKSLPDNYAEFCFEVEDTGIGISPENHRDIFQPFWSSSSKTSTGDDNTGLGLNICARLVELLKGDISFNSEPGQGSSFKVVLPFAIADQQAVEEPSQEAAPVDTASSFEGNVLLVDDNQTNLLVGQMMLENMGLQVRTASDGNDAVEISSQVNFDLIFMDITMPGMGGIEATETLRSQGYRVPIIALTAHVGEDARKQYLEAGMQNVLYKPIDPTALLQVLREWLPEQSDENQPGQPQTDSDSGHPVTAVLNKAALETLIGAIGKDNINRAFALFEKESSERIKNILNAWVQRDLGMLRDEAHTLKSSAASFGAESLANNMKAVESASRDGDTQHLVSLLKIVESSHHDSILALQEKLAEPD